jgi:plastocyanin
MRRGGVALGVATALSLWVAPALGSDGPAGRGPTVAATADNTFTPKTLTIPPNTPVYFENRGLSHNVHFEDEKFQGPTTPQPTPWRVWRTFTEVGTYRYYCDLHGGPNGQGMSGTIIVTAQASPVMSALRIKPKRVARKRKSKVTFTLSEAARVSGGVDPMPNGSKRRGLDIQFAGKKGRNTFRIAARKLDPGLYRLWLSAEDVDGNDSDVVSGFLRVKRTRR